jgi:hypothetical protein
MAFAAVNNGDRVSAWQFYRQIQEHDPSSPAIDRLMASGRFNFTSEWFGYGKSSLVNYSKGFIDGARQSAGDAVQELWHIVRHPVDSVESGAKSTSNICSRLWTQENLKLLLSPRGLFNALGDAAARLYWSAWEGCKASAARQYGLSADRFEDQKAIHEIAAGRMIGYVAPELILLILSDGTVPFSSAEKAERVAEAAAQTEQCLKDVNLIARSGEFLEDAGRFPKLRGIHWLTDEMWIALKSSSKTAPRLEKIVDHMSIVRGVPGAKGLIASIKGRLHLEDVEGHLFQLQRAASYGKEGKLEEIGRQFTVPVAQPGEPVKFMRGEADLVLKDRTLIDTKYRKRVLDLDQALHKQLLKYDRAVQDGQFAGIRIECNSRVAQQVVDRCNTIRTRGTPIEIVERVDVLQ